VDLTQLTTRGDLLLGLYDPTATGSGVTGVKFTLVADGQTVIDESFSSAAAAASYFTDDPIDLGSLDSGQLSGPTLTMQATLTVTSASAGSGFYADMIVGATSATQRFIHAAAGLGATGGQGEAWGAHEPPAHLALVAPRPAMA